MRKIIRHLQVTTRVDTFTIRVIVTDDNKEYAEYQGTRPPFVDARRVGSLIQYSPTYLEQAVTHLLTDCLNEIIAHAGPITHSEALPLPEAPDAK